MSRLDTLQKFIDTTKPIPKMTNSKAEKILRSLINRGIPMLTYIKTDNVAEAIFGDAIDEGLSATKIHIVIKKLYKSGVYVDYTSLLFSINRFAEERMSVEIYAARANMNEEAQS